MMDIIFYQAYIFYARILKEQDPVFNATWGIGAVQGFVLGFLTDILAVKFYCHEIPTFYLFVISIFIVFLNYLHFMRSKRYHKILQQKPLYKKNKHLSAVITILFFALGVGSMFIGPILSKYYWDKLCH